MTVSQYWYRFQKAVPVPYIIYKGPTWRFTCLVLQFCTRQRFDKGVISDLLPDMEDNWESLTNHGDDWFWEVRHDFKVHAVHTISSNSKSESKMQTSAFSRDLDIDKSWLMLLWATLAIFNRIAEVRSGNILKCSDKSDRTAKLLPVNALVCVSGELIIFFCSMSGPSMEPVLYLTHNST